MSNYQCKAMSTIPMGLEVRNMGIRGTIDPSNQILNPVIKVKVWDVDDPTLEVIQDFTMHFVPPGSPPSNGKSLRFITPSDLGTFELGQAIDIALEVEVVSDSGLPPLPPPPEGPPA